MVKVQVWPDGDWVETDDYNELDYSHKSDDYTVLEIKDGWSDDEIITATVMKYLDTF